MFTPKYRMFPSLRLYDFFSVPYVVAKKVDTGPSWTGTLAMLDAQNPYGDFTFFHEFVHWLVASPEQRREPDFALGRHVASTTGVFTASNVPYLYVQEAHGGDRGWGGWCVQQEVCRHQENIATQALMLYEPLVLDAPWKFYDRFGTADFYREKSCDVYGAVLSFGSAENVRTVDAVREAARMLTSNVAVPLGRKVHPSTVQTYIHDLLDFYDHDMVPLVGRKKGSVSSVDRAA